MAGALIQSQGTEAAEFSKDINRDEISVHEQVTDIDISISDTKNKEPSVIVIFDEREERKKDINKIQAYYVPLHGGLGAEDSSFSALEGIFYDLKKYKNGSPTGLNGGVEKQNKVIEALSEAFRFNAWDATELDKYYQADTRLYADYWYLPAARADYAPIEFKVGKATNPVSPWVCQPAAWVVVYRGKVIAPITGKFRFIGTGDDFLAVRFGGKTVLDAGYRLPTLWEQKNPNACRIGDSNGQQWRNNIKNGKDKQRKDYNFIKGIPGCTIWDNELGGLTAGTPFDVTEGKAYDIEIAIAEIPGDTFGFILFIEELDKKGKPKDTTKGKKYDLFRTTANNPNVREMTQALKAANCYTQDANIPFNVDSYVWVVKKD